MFLRPYTLKRNIVKGGEPQQPTGGDIEAGNGVAATVENAEITTNVGAAAVPTSGVDERPVTRSSTEKTPPEEDADADDAATATVHGHGRENSTKEKGDVERIV